MTQGKPEKCEPKSKVVQTIIGYAENLPVLIWGNDGETPSSYVDICPMYKEPYHNKMKKVKITVERIL